MVEDPEKYVESFALNGFKKFIGHVEKMPDIASFVAKAEQYGQVGLALDTPTPVTALTDVSFEDLDFLFVMTVKAGHSNQEFMPEMLEKVRSLRSQTPFLPIEVDGGINSETLPQAKEAGATDFVVTHALFTASDVNKAYQDLQALLQ